MGFGVAQRMLRTRSGGTAITGFDLHFEIRAFGKNQSDCGPTHGDEDL